MRNRPGFRVTIPLSAIFLLVGGRTPIHCQNETSQQEALLAMEKAVAFMTEKVSNRGGFLMMYTEDLSEQWGELPARKSMIWVQDPATVGVGEIFLRAYRVTGEKTYLEHCKGAANALVWGQHPSGGWHYFIDFDPSGVAKWYEEVGFRAWGWEEFYHHYGNCTFDDNVTTGAARFLLELYTETMDPAYRAPLDSALGFILESQYDRGGWPQRYPLRWNELSDRDIGYTAYYTFNDDVIPGNIDFLWEAYERFGNEEYKEAALRGMEFVLVSQLPKPQAGWAQQYDLEMRPAPARSYEPRAVSTLDTVGNIHRLMSYYKRTGDRRFFSGIPAALDWLESAERPDVLPDPNHTHAVFYEFETNKPLYGHREGTSKENGRYWNDYSVENLLRGYGYSFVLDVDGLREKYQRVKRLSPREAVVEHRMEKERQTKGARVSEEEIRRIIDSMDERGAWVEELLVQDIHDYMNNPPRKFRGISTATFIKNMNSLLDWIEAGN